MTSHLLKTHLLLEGGFFSPKMPFPENDEYWTDALEFLKKHHKAGEAVVAPAEFAEKIPDVRPYASTFAAPTEIPPWAVIHKGMPGDINEEFLIALSKKMEPVFASEVFVIFSTEKRLKTLDWDLPHIISLSENIAQLEGWELPRRAKQRAGGANAMGAGAPAPVVLTGFGALRGFAQFYRDPISAMRSAHAEHGPFVIQDSPLRIGMHRHLVAMTAGAGFNRQVLSTPETWQPVNVMFVSPKDSPSRRVGLGLFGMRGHRHAHYRELISQPLRKPGAEGGGKGRDMAALAEEFVEEWPVGRRFDLWQHARDLVRNISIALVFGDDREHAYPIADLVDKRVLFRQSPRTLACPFNVPFTPYGKMVRQSEEIERRITEWAGCKRGNPDDRDIMATLANNADENGKPISDAGIVGHVPSLFVAAYDTCQTALIWTLVLLSQHPSIARDVADELAGLEGTITGAGIAGIEKVRDLPLLDAVVKESMRLLPPLPMQARRAMHATALGDYPVPEGTRVVLSALVTNRLPDLYPDPDRFLPERWATIKPTGYEYAVFSGGPRICPGQWFGMSVLKVSLAAILTRHRVALEPGARIDYAIQPTLSPRAAVPAVLKSKEEAFTSAPLRGGITRLIQFPKDGPE